jgi:hypothetical protein
LNLVLKAADQTVAHCREDAPCLAARFFVSWFPP